MMTDRPVISFRADPDLHMRLEQARATFPKQQWGEVFSWLLHDPDVVAKIRDRVHGVPA